MNDSSHITQASDPSTGKRRWFVYYFTPGEPQNRDHISRAVIWACDVEEAVTRVRDKGLTWIQVAPAPHAE